MEFTTVLLNVVAGIVSSRAMAWFQEWAWLTKEEKSKLSGPLADWLAWALALGVGWLTGWLAQLYGLVDGSQVWMFPLISLVASKGHFFIDKAVRNLKK